MSPLFVIVPAALFCITPLYAQNFADRIVIVDPLADPTRNGPGTTWLPGTVLYAEFSRYSEGSGDDHRWNARTGGAIEVVRVDSTWSVAVMGTMEVVVDPQNDITFNPRAIFWEEGLFVTRRLGDDMALEVGYMHRCKHDIDNLEVLTRDGILEQRTLIYSGPSVRFLLRPRAIGSTPLLWGLGIRGDLLTHLLDDRLRSDARGVGRDMESGIASMTFDLRGRWRPGFRRIAIGLNLGWMASIFGDEPGLVLLGSIPYVEFGLHLFNPQGGTFVLFARGEFQRDTGIRSIPESKKLVMIGIRMGSWRATW